MDKTTTKETMLKRIDDFQQSFEQEFGIKAAVTLFDEKDVRLSLEELDKIAADYTTIPDVMRIKTRKREAVIVRHCIFAIACRMKYPLEQIGSFFGGWDHATVLHARNVFNNLLQVKDKGTTYLYQEIMRKVHEKCYHSTQLQAIEKGGLKVQPFIFPGLNPAAQYKH